MPRFSDLGLEPAIVAGLELRGIAEPTAIQVGVIPQWGAGKDMVFQSATGTGKTIAYLAPMVQAIHGDQDTTAWPQAVIAAPTYELCAQIRREAELLGGLYDPPIKAALLTGDANMQRQIERLKDLHPAIVVGTPGRIVQLSRMGKLKTRGVRHLVLDEADRLVATELRDTTAALISLLPAERHSAACSATMDTATLRILAPWLHEGFARLRLEDQEVLKERIEHWVLYSEKRKKIHTLRSFLAAAKPERTLVFIDRGDGVMNVAAQLRFHNVSATALSGDMGKVERKKAFDDFRTGRATVLVTSDLAARGLDIPEASHIVALDVPDKDAAYAHRAGRTARAGRTGVMVTIGDEGELRRLATMERRLGILIRPKMLYKGQVVEPEPVDDEEPDPETTSGATVREDSMKDSRG